RAHERIACGIERRANLRRRGAVVALRQAQQRETGLWITAVPASLVVRSLRFRELATQAADLGLLILRGRDHIRRGLGCDGMVRFRDRLLPVALQLKDLGAMHAALTVERGELRLRFAPRRQYGGPFARAIEGVDVVA